MSLSLELFSFIIFLLRYMNRIDFLFFFRFSLILVSLFCCVLWEHMKILYATNYSNKKTVHHIIFGNISIMFHQNLLLTEQLSNDLRIYNLSIWIKYDFKIKYIKTFVVKFEWVIMGTKLIMIYACSAICAAVAAAVHADDEMVWMWRKKTSRMGEQERERCIVNV